MITRTYPEEPHRISGNTLVHLNAAGEFTATHISPLSIRSTMKGVEKHNTKNSGYSVTPEKFLILNCGCECESTIESETESLAVFFGREFAEGALSSIITPGDKMLNNSFVHPAQPVTFFEKTYPHNHTISPVLMKLRFASRIDFNDNDFINENCYFLLEGLMKLHRDLYNEITKLPPVKLSTKTELYRRICMAKEFIDDCYTEKIRLEDIAKHACLSQFHFLRVFRTIFGQTPHQYVLGKRMTKALDLLRRSEMPVTQVCYEIGLESPGSFSRMFRIRFGISPESFREQHNSFLYTFRML